MRRIPWLVPGALAVLGACAGRGATPPAPPARAASGLASVWALGDGDKVAHDALASSFKAGNSVWNGATIRLFGARNEVLAFQVVVEAGARGIDELRAALPQLQQRGGTSRIAWAPPAHDPTLYVGRPIQIFSVNDMAVERETAAAWAWIPGSPAVPRWTTGWQPVQLVPGNAHPGRGGFPLRVPPRTNQVLWVEVYTGRDRPSGLYEGSLTITAGREARTLPVELTLFDFDLPDANSLDAMVYFDVDQPALYHGRRLDPAYHRLARRHRVEFVHAYGEAAVRNAIGRFTGADFTRANGYEGPGEATGNRIVPLTFYGAGRAFQERESAWRRADAWMAFVDSALTGSTRTFVYLFDEPYPEQFDEVRRLAGNVRSNPGPGRRLPTLLTKRIEAAFEGLVDIWCIPPQAFDVAAAAAARAKGNRLCVYNGGRPNGSAIVIDAPATEARAVAWAAFKHDVDLYFYWNATHWRHNPQKQGERNQDVWANPVTFDNRGQPNKPLADQGFLNGDGVLVYPGEDVLHPDQDRGIAGPISTIQLANLRRGLQDHLYLSLARRLGLDQAVERALRTVVPRVFSDAGASVGFAESGEAFEAARRSLAEAIAAAMAGRRR